jgi:hypothetical protein
MPWTRALLTLTRVDVGSIGFPKAYAAQMTGGVFAKGPIPIPEVERSLQSTDGIVVYLLAPVVPIGDGDQMGIADLLKDKMTDLWAPDAVEYFSIRIHCGRCHIVAGRRAWQWARYSSKTSPHR